MTPTPGSWPRGPSNAGMTPGERLRAQQDTPPPPVPGEGEFDPSEHTVREVNIYLETAGLEERDRVLALEAAGRNRSGILSMWATDDDGA